MNESTEAQLRMREEKEAKKVDEHSTQLLFGNESVEGRMNETLSSEIEPPVGDEE